MQVAAALVLFLLFMIPGVIAVGPSRFLSLRRIAVTVSAVCWSPLIFSNVLHISPLFALPVAIGGAFLARRLIRRAEPPPRPPARALVAILGVVVTMLVIHVLITFPEGIPRHTTPWYYAGLAEQTRVDGGFPGTAVEWGITVPFLLDYPYFTALGAASSSLLSLFLDLAHRVEAFRLFSIILTAWMAAETFYALGRRVIAIPVTVVMLSCSHFLGKMAGYRPEAFAYVFALLFVWACLDSGFKLFVSSTEQQPRRTLFLSMALPLLLCLLTHGIVAAIAFAALIPIALMSAIRHRAWRPATVLTVQIVIATLAVYIGTDLLVAKEVTQLHNATAPLKAVKESKDLTFEFFKNYRGAHRAKKDDDLHARMTTRLAARFQVFTLPAWISFAAMALAIVVALALRARRYEALFVLGWAMAIGAGGAVFVLGWDTYVPQRIGPSRIWPLLTVPGFMALALGLSAAAETGFFKRLKLRDAWVYAGLVCLLVALAFAAGDDIDRRGNEGIGRQDYLFLRDHRFAPTDIVLTNNFNEGSLATISGGNCFVGGIAPYNKDDAILALSVRHMKQARRFFRRPTKEVACRMGIDYIVEARRPWSLGMRFNFKSNGKRLAKLFTLVESEPKGRIRIYKTDCGDD